MRFSIPFPSGKRWHDVRFLLVTMVISFPFAYFVDQYYILEKKWFFLLELVR